MKKILTLLSIILLLPFLSSAQSNFKPGYVVTLQGDTLKGAIDYREWDNNPKQITYKDNNDQTQEFNVRNAKAFAINGLEYYERYIVSVSQDPVDINKISSKLDTSYHIDTVFLHVLAKGKNLALYSYNDDIKLRFYISETASPQLPQELEFHAFYNPDATSTVHYVRRYRIQLQYEAEKNGKENSLSGLIPEADYNESDLVKIVNKINGDSELHLTSKNLFGTRWFAGAAITHNKLDFIGNFSLANAPASNSVTPRINAGIDIFPNKTIQKFYFRLEISYAYGKYSFFYADEYSTPVGSSASLNLNQYNGIFTPQVVYNLYNSEQLKVFADVGMAINFSFYNHYRYTITYTNFPEKVFDDRYPQFYKTWAAFPLKAGIAIKKRVELYASYTPT
ncbi:MAG: hypothetical protein ACTHJ8_06275, partial [Mucilaginibacter sp.]